jgi:chemotaxis protein CheC
MKLSDMEQDTLIEIANIGAGNATTPLSKIFDTKVDLSISRLDIISLKGTLSNAELKKQFAVGMHTPIIKGLSSEIAILFTANNINKLISMKKENKLSKERFLEQIGEIISNAYAYSLKEFLKLNLVCGKTALLSNLPAVELILNRLKEKGNEAIFIKTNYIIQKAGLSGTFILILAMPSISELISKANRVTA